MQLRLPREKRNVDRNCRREGEEFCIFPICTVCSLPSRSILLRSPPLSLLLSSSFTLGYSRRIALVFRFAFSRLFLAFGQRQIPREPRYSWSVEGCFSRFRPLPSRLRRLPSRCPFRLLRPLVRILFFFFSSAFILHGITSGDDGIPESKTRSFEFVEILKDVVDLLSSTVLSLFRLCNPLPSLPPPPSSTPLDPPASYRRLPASPLPGCSS